MEEVNTVNVKERPEGLKPSEIVEKLDSYIIGQNKAKRFVAVALRNRQRRIRLPEEIREEVAPKNILMIGPTGVGKTEIARRLAKLCGAPFLKVEATKYTEVGYVGRDVESMVRDLMAVSFSMVKSEMKEALKEKVGPAVEDALLDLLLPGSGNKKNKPSAADSGKSVKVIGNIFGENSPIQGSLIRIENSKVPDSAESEVKVEESEKSQEEEKTDMSTREKFRQMLRNGLLEDRTVEVTVRQNNRVMGMDMLQSGNPEDFQESLKGLQEMLSGGGLHRKTVTVAEARKILLQEELEKSIDNDKVADEAKKRVEQSGIIFIDEIDKIAVRGGESGRQDVSREGVQRDILPIVEGCDVNTKWGVVNTTHILFIGAGAFSVAAPGDLIPELQGRFPLRVELEALNKDDFRRILTEPKNALVKQYEALMATEGVKLEFTDEALKAIAKKAIAKDTGARALRSIIEKFMLDIMFEIPKDDHIGTVTITDKYINGTGGPIIGMRGQDLIEG